MGEDCVLSFSIHAMTRDESIIASNWKQGKGHRVCRRDAREKGNDSQFVHGNRSLTLQTRSATRRRTRDARQICLQSRHLSCLRFYCMRHMIIKVEGMPSLAVCVCALTAKREQQFASQAKGIHASPDVEQKTTRTPLPSSFPGLLSVTHSPYAATGLPSARSLN